MRPFIAATAAIVLAAPVWAAAQDANEMSCRAYGQLDIGAQKEVLADLQAATEPDEGGGVVPPESTLAGEEAVTALVAACAATPEAPLGETMRELFGGD
ncbi:hypothetical protein E2L08_14445 [Palleronia sediminis]|uniref:HdeA/HdeB family protein n=1 Tax=Palleronia sediminis TaxID=2547833 RepID=A0A4R6A4K0_9RHOB|nr:hypothetical protein [Palleronia sediminis]TDL76026.1 hypothetical protein E2L08_14445 [Palleronia sediminis]